MIFEKKRGQNPNKWTSSNEKSWERNFIGGNYAYQFVALTAAQNENRKQKQHSLFYSLIVNTDALQYIASVSLHR
jgi:hypothetical protein